MTILPSIFHTCRSYYRLFFTPLPYYPLFFTTLTRASFSLQQQECSTQRAVSVIQEWRSARNTTQDDGHKVRPADLLKDPLMAGYSRRSTGQTFCLSSCVVNDRISAGQTFCRSLAKYSVRFSTLKKQRRHIACFSLG